MGRSSSQEICCLLGQPVAGNPTQFMIERAFAHHGLDWRYLTLEVGPDELADAIRGMRAMGFRGGNITRPHKITVVPLLDRLGQSASMMGAVNCIVRHERELVGENTDGKGFLRALRSVTEPTGKRIVLFGSGGAARAIGVELALAGVSRITVVNRSAERGQELVDLLNNKTSVPAELVLWEGEYPLNEEADVAINATSIGQNDPDARVPLNWDGAKKDLIVADAVVTPPDTRFLAEASGRGFRTLDGLGMIVQQAIIGFELWTGVTPEAQIMRDAAEEFLGI